MTNALTRVAEVPTVVLDGEIDPRELTAFEPTVCAALDAGQQRVVVNLHTVSVLGAPALSLFCATLRRLAGRGAALTIVGAPEPVERVGEIERHFRDRGWVARVPRDLQDLALRRASRRCTVSRMIRSSIARLRLEAEAIESTQRSPHASRRSADHRSMAA